MGLGISYVAFGGRACWLVERLYLCQRHDGNVYPTFYLEEIWWRVALYSWAKARGRRGSVGLCRNRHSRVCTYGNLYNWGIL